MLVSPCLPLLSRVMVWVMLSLFCGSNAAFPVTALNLLRYVADYSRAAYLYFLSSYLTFVYLKFSSFTNTSDFDIRYALCCVLTMALASLVLTTQ